jgi:hypothetical protein
MSTYLNDKTRSRGLRNNNPLNLRKTYAKWLGKIPSTDKDFEQFTSLEMGLRAGAINIKTQINVRKKNTVAKLIYTYAPPNENDTLNYINTISRAVNIDPNATIKADTETLYKLIRPMLKMEIGNDENLISDTQILNAVNAALNIQQKDENKETKPTAGILADAGLFILLLLVFIYFIIKL